jgi:four helix bundle protein
MATFKRFEEIDAWKLARELVRECYKACSASAIRRDFGMRDQLTRAALSVGSNIAEGFGRNSDKEFARYLDIAKASAMEVKSILYTAEDVGLVDVPTAARIRDIADRSAGAATGLAKYLRGKPKQSPMGS